MKRNEFYYENRDYKILEPNKNLKEEILIKLINISKNKNNDNNFNAELTLWLCQKVAVSDDNKYNCNNTLIKEQEFLI